MVKVQLVLKLQLYLKMHMAEPYGISVAEQAFSSPIKA
jgi:hypothetical protein